MKKVITALLCSATLIGNSIFANAFEALEVGSQGAEVVELQQALIEKGFLSGSADGIFGNGTAVAVSDFQASVGLPVTGIVDEKTQSSLQGERVVIEEKVIDNEEAWTQLYNEIQQKGINVYGNKGFLKPSDNHYTLIGIPEDDPDTIIICTRSDYMAVDPDVDEYSQRRDFNIYLKKNSAIANFSMDSQRTIGLGDATSESYCKGSGYLDITTLSPESNLVFLDYSEDTTDIYGNHIETYNPAKDYISIIIDEADEILKENSSISMKSLGFYTGLESDIVLNEGETVIALGEDYYSVIPQEWTVNSTKTKGMMRLEVSGDTNNLIFYQPIQFGQKQKDMDMEEMFDNVKYNFSNSGYVVTDEKKDITISGFPTRYTEFYFESNGNKGTISHTSLYINNGEYKPDIFQIYYVHYLDSDKDCSNIYDRMLETFYYDPSGKVMEAINSNVS